MLVPLAHREAGSWQSGSVRPGAGGGDTGCPSWSSKETTGPVSRRGDWYSGRSNACVAPRTTTILEVAA